MKNFESHFDCVVPIVLKLKRSYFVQLWEHDDWLQEGRVVLYHLLESMPDLMLDKKKLRVYFKTKFSNYLNDVIRHQESQKRKFNKMPYEEISEMGNSISKKEMIVDDYIAYQTILSQLENSLVCDEKEMLKKVISGERFKGKKKFIAKIRPYFTDFN